MESTITKAQSRTSTLNRNLEIFGLTPSTLLTLWEIDASVLLDDVGIKSYDYDAVFRFHNSVKLTNTSIKWREKDYIAVPIQVEGFEYSGKGSPPTPKLSLAVNEEGIPALALLKSTLRQLDDLTGVKVTRRRVFAKYIDNENFPQLTQEDSSPKQETGQFTPDPNMQFDVDVFYIDRKSMENKSMIEFELGALTDVEGTQLPGRICNSKRCPWSYRAHGCLWEYQANRVSFIHGTTSVMPKEAPPVANSKGELITNILGPGVKIEVQGEYSRNKTYNKGWAVYIQKDGIKYYFVALANGVTAPPPNPLFWVEDLCDKLINGCRLRHGTVGDGSLPIGSFVGISAGG